MIITVKSPIVKRSLWKSRTFSEILQDNWVFLDPVPPEYGCQFCGRDGFPAIQYTGQMSKPAQDLRCGVLLPQSAQIQIPFPLAEPPTVGRQ